MGCRTSKVLPEPPADVQLDLVKKVEPHQTDVYKNFIKSDGGGGKTGSPSPQGQSQAAAKVSQSPPPANGQPEPADPHRKKVAKYRAKFDPRVTAKYDIKALIGRGSFSRVVRVEHRSTRQPYAIKMIETRYREGREVCESELCVLRRVRHTNIIQLMEVFETAERGLHGDGVGHWRRTVRPHHSPRVFHRKGRHAGAADGSRWGEVPPYVGHHAQGPKAWKLALLPSWCWFQDHDHRLWLGQHAEERRRMPDEDYLWNTWVHRSGDTCPKAIH